MTRAATAAILGGLVAVVGWTAWSTLGLREASQATLTADTVENAAPPSAGAPRVTLTPPTAPEPVKVASVAMPPPSAARVATAPPPLRDGLVMEHGLPTAVHALAGDGGAQPAPPAGIALPAGAQPGDATVNGAGMVTLNRSTDARANGGTPPAGLARPATAEQAP